MKAVDGFNMEYRLCKRNNKANLTMEWQEPEHRLKLLKEESASMRLTLH